MLTNIFEGFNSTLCIIVISISDRLQSSLFTLKGRSSTITITKIVFTAEFEENSNNNNNMDAVASFNLDGHVNSTSGKNLC